MKHMQLQNLKLHSTANLDNQCDTVLGRAMLTPTKTTASGLEKIVYKIYLVSCAKAAEVGIACL